MKKNIIVLFILFILTGCSSPFTSREVEDRIKQGNTIDIKQYISFEVMNFRHPTESISNQAKHKIKIKNITNTPISLEIFITCHDDIKEYIYNDHLGNIINHSLTLESNQNWIINYDFTLLEDYKDYSLGVKSLINDLISKSYYKLKINDEIVYFEYDFLTDEFRSE